MVAPRWLIVTAMAAAVLSQSVAPASAADPGGDLRAVVEKADAVFTGSVVTSSVETVGTGTKARALRQYTVQVDRLYQGKVARERVLVTSKLSKTCGYGAIPTGRPWVFVVHGRGEKFFGNLCGGTASATEAYVGRVEKLLGAGTAVAPPAPARDPLQYVALDVPDPTPLTRLLAPGAGVTLLGLLGLVLFRRRTAGS